MVVWGTLAPRCPLCKPTTTGIYRRFTNTYKTAAIQHHVSDEERTHKACQDNSNWIRCNQSAKLLSALAFQVQNYFPPFQTRYLLLSQPLVSGRFVIYKLSDLISIWCLLTLSLPELALSLVGFLAIPFAFPLL